MKKFIPALILAGLLFTGCTTPRDLTVEIDAPTQVELGEAFEVHVNIKNESTEARILMSIDVGHDYLEGIVLEESTPAYSESWDFDLLGFMSYDYEKEIPAGESLEVIYLMSAITTGDYSGSFDVCIDTEMHCVYNIVRTVVEETGEL